MANDVVFIKGQGGLGRPLAGEDHISGLLFYSDATLPTGFTSNDRIKQVFSVADAEALGITDAHLGETAATGTVTITGVGANGDTLKIEVNTIDGAVDLGTYTKVNTDTTVTNVADAIEVIVNAGTSTHGYTCSNVAGVITFVAPSGMGVGANGDTFTVTIVGTMTATNAAFSGGVCSDIDILHYHISEYFRVQPKGNLYVGIYALSGVSTFSAITTMQDFALGKIRQIGIYQKSTNFATSQLATIQGVLDTNYTNHKPLEAIYQPNFSAVSDITTLNDLRTLDAENVSVCFGQDGANTGYTLWLATNKSIGCLGTTLGAVSLAKVNEDIAWVGKFNMASEEFDTLAFANGDVYTSISDGNRDNVDAKGYVFLKKHIGISGSYFSDSHTAIPLTSDYAYIENNRTIHKAIRGLRTFLLPQLASPVLVNEDGTLTEDVIAYYETLCARALDVMRRDSEISAYSVTIDPTQDILSTSTLEVTVKIVPVGVARQIEVNVGFAVSI